MKLVVDAQLQDVSLTSYVRQRLKQSISFEISTKLAAVLVTG